MKTTYYSLAGASNVLAMHATTLIRAADTVKDQSGRILFQRIIALTWSRTNLVIGLVIK